MGLIYVLKSGLNERLNRTAAPTPAEVSVLFPGIQEPRGSGAHSPLHRSFLRFMHSEQLWQIEVRAAQTIYTLRIIPFIF